MKSKLLLSSPCQIATSGLLLGIALLAAGSASAQNFVRNPDFDQPLGPDNWTVVYTNVINSSSPNAPTNCGPMDFLIAGRTTLAHKDLDPGIWDGEDGTGTNYWLKFGGHFAPNHSWMMHAYFSQIVSNLTVGQNYMVSAWMAQFTDSDNTVAACQVYLSPSAWQPRKVPMPISAS